jgi:hypothetical protein
VAISQIALARNSPTKFEAGIQRLFLEAAPLLDLIPTVTNGSLQGRYRRLLTLPTVSPRRLYEAFPESQGGWTTEAFDIPIYGGMLRIDEQLLSEPGGAEEWADQIELYSQAMAFQLNNDAINGDKAVDPDAMDGLKVHQAAQPARMTLAPTVAGDLDLTTSALRKTNAPELIRLMDLAFQRIQQGTGGNPNLVIMADDLINLMADAWRQSGFLETTQDSIGRSFMTYKGAKIVPAGFTYAEALTQTDAANAVIGSNFDGDGNTSMLFLRTGTQYVRWVQKHALKVSEAKTNADGSSDDEMVTRVKKVEHPITIHVKHPYSAARLTGITIS